MQRIIFICTHNSARSQMAEGLMRHHFGDRFEVASAGTEQTRVHPGALSAMTDIGIDISGHTSKTTAGYKGQDFDYIVTVCDSAADACPVFYASGERIHRSFVDPSATQGNEAAVLAAFCKTRDQIQAWLLETFA